jgi:hypothetical protein
MIGATNLTGLDPVQTFQNLVTVATTGGSSSLYNATGSQLTYINTTSSYAISASYEILMELSSTYATSASWADFARSSSFGVFSTSASFGVFATSASHAVTSSFISPPAGTVNTTTVPTGSSAGAAGFASVTELGQFILDVSSSVMILNDLITKLKLKGIIS